MRVDTIPVTDDPGMRVDTIRGDIGISPDAIDQPIVYSAIDSQYMDNKTHKVYLINGAVVTYGDIKLESYYIEYDMATNEVFARGRIDSLGKLVETPKFSEGSEEFESEELVYNFKTKLGVIRKIITEQEGGYLHSEVTKMQNDGSLHVADSKYTTCDAPDPHFYVKLPKAKMIPGDKIISGPAYLVLEDVPLPIALPFGFFPVQKEVASGILIPQYGEERNRGYFLKNGGYYFVINDYLDLKLTGDMYTNGTWRTTVQSNYNLRYKFKGGFTFSYASNVTGHKTLEDYSKSSNYSIRWTHSQDAKASPGSRFSASVNMSSSGYDRQNSYNPMDHVNSTKQSSVSYSKTWAGTPFNFSASLNHSQNTQRKTVSLNLPKASFSMNRIYPLKFNKSGSSKWWQELQIQYTANIDNRINTVDSLLFTPAVWDDMDNGFKQDIPISLPIRPFNNFSISPQIRYSGVLYTKRLQKIWDEHYYDPAVNDTIKKVVSEYQSGLFYGQAFSPSISASYSPQIFGTYSFINPDSRIIAVRHVLRPSVSFSYIPSLDGMSTNMYRKVQKDTLGNMEEYSIFQGRIFGTPSLPKRNGTVSLSLVNIIEAKVRSRSDTTGKGEKVKIIDNLAFNTSYNIYADSLKWAPMSMVFRTSLLKEVDVSARGTFDFYALDENNRRINTSMWEQSRKPFRLTSFNISLGFDLKRFIDAYFGGSGSGSESGLGSQSGQAAATPRGNEEMTGNIDEGIMTGNSRTVNPAEGLMQFDEFGYARFDVPWSMSVAYNFFFTKTGTEAMINQNMTLNGTVTLTRNWNITYSTGYDFRMKEITMSRIGVTRDLHCWEMSFNWVPTGYLQSWDFTIRVKSAVLQDLKYERRKDFHDN